MPVCQKASQSCPEFFWRNRAKLSMLPHNMAILNLEYNNYGNKPVAAGGAQSSDAIRD